MSKKLLLTGGAGFVGHHLVEGVLKNTDWEIVILDCLTYAGNLNRLTDILIWEKEKHRVKFIWHDLKSPIAETTHKMIGDLDYIWNLAAESHVERSLEDSIPFVMSNVLGTANLLEYIKHYQPNLKKFVQFSTDEVYGPAPEGVYYKEWDRLKPSNPYSGAKAGGDMMAFAFAHSFGLPILITRSMNIFGERQHPEKFIPKTVKTILEGKPVLVHGVPGQISSRCWIHARNVCDALLFLMEKGEREDIYNIVGEERSALDLANRISRIIKNRDLAENEIEYLDYHKTRPGHDRRYALDGTKLKEMGWQPKFTLDQSFDKMIRWMLENKKWLKL
ncbi:MAG: GDP-mannose 4,6-dehydratase [Candidatus Pacebacteria bacterium]|nr:GDP-mannose 4,6-dehydratase [Candidatus Paceibacterota bacterium]